MAISVPMAKHFAMLIFPFRHGLSGKHSAARLAKLSAMWGHWWSRFQEDGVAALLDDTFFFLPRVREWFFPELRELPSNLSDPRVVEKAAELAAQPLEHWGNVLASGNLLRLTLRREMLPPEGLVEVKSTYESQERYRARVHWVDCLLFPHNVGMLACKVELVGDGQLSTSQLNDFLFYARQVQPMNLQWKLPVWVWGQARAEARQWLDYLLQGLTDPPGNEDLVVDLAAFLAAKAQQKTTLGVAESQPFFDAFFRLVFAAVEGEGLQRVSFLANFPSSQDRLCYELVSCTDTDDPLYVPAREFVDRLLRERSLALFENWRGVILDRGLGIVAPVAGDGDAVEMLSRNSEFDYCHLVFLGLFLRMRLATMFEETVMRERKLGRNVKEAKRLWAQLVDFENRYVFSEVTSKPIGNTIFRRYTQGLGLREIFDELATKVTHAQEYYEGVAAENITWLLNVLTFFAAPLGILAQFFAPALVKEASWGQFLLWLLLVYAVAFALWLLRRFRARKA